MLQAELHLFNAINGFYCQMRDPISKKKKKKKKIYVNNTKKLDTMIRKQSSRYLYSGESPRKSDVKHELRSLGGKGGQLVNLTT